MSAWSGIWYWVGVAFIGTVIWWFWRYPLRDWHAWSDRASTQSWTEAMDAMRRAGTTPPAPVDNTDWVAGSVTYEIPNATLIAMPDWLADWTDAGLRGPGVVWRSETHRDETITRIAFSGGPTILHDVFAWLAAADIEAAIIRIRGM